MIQLTFPNHHLTFDIHVYLKINLPISNFVCISIPSAGETNYTWLKIPIYQSMDLEEPEGEDCFLASMQDTLSRDLSLQRCSNFRLELDRHDLTTRGRRRGVDRLWALGY